MRRKGEDDRHLEGAERYMVDTKYARGQELAVELDVCR